MVIKKLLQLFICKIYAELFKTIKLKKYQRKQIKEREELFQEERDHENSQL